MIEAAKQATAGNVYAATYDASHESWYGTWEAINADSGNDAFHLMDHVGRWGATDERVFDAVSSAIIVAIREDVLRYG